jgi:hypothetical protein
MAEEQPTEIQSHSSNTGRNETMAQSTNGCAILLHAYFTRTARSATQRVLTVDGGEPN